MILLKLIRRWWAFWNYSPSLEAENAAIIATQTLNYILGAASRDQSGGPYRAPGTVERDRPPPTKIPGPSKNVSM